MYCEEAGWPCVLSLVSINCVYELVAINRYDVRYVGQQGVWLYLLCLLL